jgi:hypothetical protein
MADSDVTVTPDPAACATSPEAGAEGANGASLEELEHQLAAMEAEESELASRLQQQSELVEPQLDSRLAVIEEQFRKSFDDRLRGSSTNPPPSVARRPAGSGAVSEGVDAADVLLINRVFRDVSRQMGDEWRPVFDALMTSYPTDVVQTEREALERQPTLIQGYRALMAWKEICAADFDVRRLIEVLRTCNMDDIADAAVALLERRDTKDDQKTKQSKPIQRRKSDVTSKGKSGTMDNRRMLLLAKKVGGDWEPLGRALGVSEDELAEIKDSADASTYQGAFKMLWAWRQSIPAGDDEGATAALRSALEQVNKGQLLDQLAAA